MLTLPLDFFGVSAIGLIQSLMDQSSNKRKRKTAFNSLERLAKACGLISRAANLEFIGIITDSAGQIQIGYKVRTPEDSFPLKVPPITK